MKLIEIDNNPINDYNVNFSLQCIVNFDDTKRVTSNNEVKAYENIMSSYGMVIPIVTLNNKAIGDIYVTVFMKEFNTIETIFLIRRSAKKYETLIETGIKNTISDNIYVAADLNNDEIYKSLLLTTDQLTSQNGINAIGKYMRVKNVGFKGKFDNNIFKYIVDSFIENMVGAFIKLDTPSNKEESIRSNNIKLYLSEK
jgi:hypothetical protein